jgi:hypothetical protein
MGGSQDKIKSKDGVAEVVYERMNDELSTKSLITYKVLTLKKALEEGAVIKRPGSSEPLNLEELCEFIEMWDEEFKSVMEDRDEMQAKDNTNLGLKFQSIYFQEEIQNFDRQRKGKL